MTRNRGAGVVGERPEDLGGVIEGYIDLLIETPDGLIIVDWKTDSVASEGDVDAKLATYELQGAAYAAALEAATGVSVLDLRFVVSRDSGVIERRVTDLPTAVERVKKSAQVETLAHADRFYPVKALPQGRSVHRHTDGSAAALLRQSVL